MAKTLEQRITQLEKLITDLWVQWETMKQYGFVPANAKGVQDEPRNGVQLCRNHQLLFDAYIYYIRWMPEVIF